MIFIFIFISVRLDMLLHLNYIKNFTIIVFIVNELVSICENAGVMGFPIPKPIEMAIDLLRKKYEIGDDKKWQLKKFLKNMQLCQMKNNRGNWYPYLFLSNCIRGDLIGWY